METFKLNNLRELSTEEQLNLKGGSGSPCDSGCSCACGCSCECDDLNPSSSITNVESTNKMQSMHKNVLREVMRRRAEELGY